MKKKRIIICIGIILLFSVGVYYFLVSSQQKKYIGVWSSQNTGQIIQIFEDNTVFLYQTTSVDDQEKIFFAKIGKLDKGKITFSQKYDAQGCLNIYVSVDEIPEDDFLSILNVYSIELQEKDVFTITDVTNSDNDAKTFFRKISDKKMKNKFPNSKEASDYKATVFFSENTSKEQKNNLKEKIEAMDGVVSVTYISSDEMWNQFKEQYYDEDDDSAEGFKSDNPLSNSDCLEIVYKIKYEETLFSKLEESEEVGRINK